MRKDKINNATCLNIGNNRPWLPGGDHLTAALKAWRQRLSYFSILTAVPAVMGWPMHEARADEPMTPTAPAPTTGQAERRHTRLVNGYRKPMLLQRQNGYLLPHQNVKPDIVSSFTGGGDDCPGAAIPIGAYTPAAPFVDTSDTHGANNTINRLYYYYYYSTDVAGPDVIYSFTLTSRGPGAEIRVIPTTASYNPAIYLLDGRGGCPNGTGNAVYYWMYRNDGGRGEAEVFDADWINSLPLNVPLHLVVDGTASGDAGPYTLRVQDVTIASGPRTKFDFNGDSYAEVSVFRPSDGVWYMSRGGSQFTGTPFGVSTDRIVPADYDGDGKTDIAIYRDGTWWWIDSSNNAVRVAEFGLASDTPVPADFTGDGRAELAIYRDGVWWTYNLANGQVASAEFGTVADKPVPADYDGDGRTDRAVYRDGIWYFDRSAQGFAVLSWGLPTDTLVPADYDGDGRIDPAVYRDGDWWIVGSRLGNRLLHFGTAADIPAPAAYNGNFADIAYYRDGVWYFHSSPYFQGSWEWNIQFGAATDKPTTSAYNR